MPAMLPMSVVVLERWASYVLQLALWSILVGACQHSATAIV
jgi:hypothetical protein